MFRSRESAAQCSMEARSMAARAATEGIEAAARRSTGARVLRASLAAARRRGGVPRLEWRACGSAPFVCGSAHCFRFHVPSQSIACRRAIEHRGLRAPQAGAAAAVPCSRRRRVPAGAGGGGREPASGRAD